MNKKDCIVDYYLSIKAYYMYLQGLFNNNLEYQKLILDKKYMDGIRVASVANMLLSIKETIVEKEGELQYLAKIYDQSLERVVELIANKTLMVMK